MRNFVIWTEEETEELRKRYSSTDTRELADVLNKPYSALFRKACQLNLKKSSYTDWSELEVEMLKSCYPADGKKTVVEKLYPRTWEMIKKKATALGLRRNTKGMDKIRADVSSLMKSDNVAAYWMGFLMADGHFSKNNRIKLIVHRRDETQLKRFRVFITHTGKLQRYKNTVGISVMDGYTVPKLKAAFDISNRKTYNPPNTNVFMNMSDDYLISLLIGFIDGDGHIHVTKSGKFRGITVKCHESWLDSLNVFIGRINKILHTSIPYGKINSAGYARINITKHVVAKYLHDFSHTHNLPSMRRKWDKVIVNESFCHSSSS